MLHIWTNISISQIAGHFEQFICDIAFQTLIKLLKVNTLCFVDSTTNTLIFMSEMNLNFNRHNRIVSHYEPEPEDLLITQKNREHPKLTFLSEYSYAEDL